jgi:hypothetical protein
MTFATLAAAALAQNYAVLGESVTVDGDTVTAIFESEYQAAFDVAGSTPALRVIAADVPGVAAGDAVVRDGVAYTVLNVGEIGPDALELRLTLQRD